MLDSTQSKSESKSISKKTVTIELKLNKTDCDCDSDDDKDFVRRRYSMTFSIPQMDTKPFHVAVIGNAGIDTNIYFPGAAIDFSREANFTENIDYIGQAGGYSARGFARLGYRTAFIGYLGDDFQGRFIREQFNADGINGEAIFTDPQGTSRSINFMYPDGRRKNFYDGKGHMHFQPDPEIWRPVLAGSTLALFHIPNWARQLLPAARDLGVTIACDLQDIVNLDDPYRQDFIAGADILFFSTVNHDGPEPIIRHILKRYPDKIILSGMGDRGCALGTKEGIEYFPVWDMEAPVIDTNGAGDALAVGFLSSYLFEGYHLREAVQRGQIAARYTCTLKASTSNLISRKKLDELFTKR